MKNFLPNLSLSLLPFHKSPYMVIFHITKRCNLRCSYCFGEYYSQKGELSLPQIKKILTEFYSMGARRLGLTGGEPLLYKHINQVIKFAKHLGFDIGLNSNGILVPSHLPALKLLSNLSISLDGSSAKTHDKFRGSGSFKKALLGIEEAHKASISLHLCFTLTPNNLSNWKKVVKLGEKYQAPVLISPLYPKLENNSFSFTPTFEKKMKKTIKEIILEKKKNSYIFFSKDTYQLLLTWTNFKEDISFKKEAGHPTCYSGKKMVTLDNYGNLFPCARLTESLPGQNCLKIGVKKAYENLSSPSCKSCRWACFIEYNLLFSLKPSAILNFLQQHN